jgi:hypothetical protein
MPSLGLMQIYIYIYSEKLIYICIYIGIFLLFPNIAYSECIQVVVVVVNLRDSMKFIWRLKLLSRFSGMVYFSRSKVISIMLILLSFPELHQDQLKYKECKLLLDML